MPLQDTECHAALRRWRGVLLKPKQTPLPCFPPKGQTKSCEGNKAIRLSSPHTEEGILRRRGSVQSDVEKEPKSAFLAAQVSTPLSPPIATPLSPQRPPLSPSQRRLLAQPEEKSLLGASGSLSGSDLSIVS
ncbi:unnamed protein product [Effrenium voratum]|nr:unnamed protein product [Effrenium voratum]